MTGLPEFRVGERVHIKYKVPTPATGTRGEVSRVEPGVVVIQSAKSGAEVTVPLDNIEEATAGRVGARFLGWGSRWDAPVDPTAATLARQASTQLGYVAAGAAVVAAVGSVLPWASAQSGLGSISITGTDGDGVLTLWLAVLVAVLAFPLATGFRRRRPLALLGALALVALSTFDLVNTSNRLIDASSESTHASVGYGLWVVVAGAVVAVLALAVSMAHRTGD
jgi:hypothetical protein